MERGRGKKGKEGGGRGEGGGAKDSVKAKMTELPNYGKFKLSWTNLFSFCKSFTILCLTYHPYS